MKTNWNFQYNEGMIIGYCIIHSLVFIIIVGIPWATVKVTLLGLGLDWGQFDTPLNMWLIPHSTYYRL